MKLKVTLFFFVASLFATIAQAQITGLVFRDFNGNGTRQANEPLVPGVTIKAYNAADVEVATATSVATGTSTPLRNYTITPPAYPVRLEFQLTNATTTNCFFTGGVDYSAFAGSGFGTNVKFVTAAGNNNNYGISYPGEYVTNGNPEILTSIYTNGNLANANAADGGNRTNALKISYNTAATAHSNDDEANITRVNQHFSMGSVWGVAYSPQADRAFYSAVLKRHAAIGPSGTGAIYITDPNTTTGATLFANLDALGFPTRATTGTYPYTAAPTGQAPAVGAIPFTGVIGTNAQRGITNTTTGYTAPATPTGTPGGDFYSYDAAAFAQAAKVGLGGLDISDDGRFLFVMNLFDRKLYRIRIANPKTPGVPAVTAADVTSYTLPDPGYTDGVARPWAVKYYRGKVLIGLTNDLSTATTLAGSTGIANGSENTVPKYANARGTIYTLDDPSGTGTGFTKVTDIELDYPRLNAAGEINEFNNLSANPTTTSNGVNENHIFRFNKWSDNYALFKQDNATGNMKLCYPQAIISDIEFDIENNGIIVSVLDRTGLQTGYRNFGPYDDGPDDGALGGVQSSGGCSEIAAGDVIRVPLNATCGIGAISPASGNAVAEFYDGDEFRSDFAANTNGGFDDPDLQHGEIASGGLTLVVGKDQVVINCYDPASDVNSGGIKMLFNSGANAGDAPNSGVANTDNSEYGANVYGGPNVNTTRGINNAKGAGMGDIEAIKELPPIEIGNRVWNDANGDGIQNPGEAGIAGVILELVDDAGNAIDSDPTTAGVQATVVTTDADGEWFLTSRTGTDAVGINFGVALEPNTAYKVRLVTAGAGNDWNPALNGGQGGGRAGSDLAGLQLTKTDVVGNGAPDFSDNDAMLMSSVPNIMFTTGPDGFTNYNLDMGFKGLASLGDKVWRDDDKDGILDSNEPGVAGITVTLFRLGGPDGDAGTAADNNIPYATTTTDASGMYLFENLPVDSYEVLFTLPANYTFTTQTNSVDNTTLTGGSTAANGSDASTAATNFGRTGNIVLSAGENNRNVDAGIVFNTPTKQSLGDRVWLDNGDGTGGVASNGTQDGTEPGVAGVTVTLYNNTGVAVATTITDANGNYLFDDIAVGTYTVGFTLPPGYNFTTNSGAVTGTTNSDANATTGRTANITVAAGNNIRYVDAGLVPQSATNASLGNFVWYDVNQDGIQDANEPGVGGVTVQLLDNAGSVERTTTTDAFGQYQFNDLTPNTPYRVRFTLPTGYTFTTNNAGTNDYINSDAGRGGSTATTATSQVVSLASTQNNPSIDAGIYQTGSNTNGRIGDKVFYDNDNNGVANNDEAGVPGVTVKLYTNGADGIPGNADDVLVATTVTDANGNYQFVNLGNGNYNVGFMNLPSGYSFTTPNVGSGATPDANDSDVSPATGRTGTYTIDVSTPATRNIQTVDAGIVPGRPAGLGSLGNKVWYDLNGNGVQDAGELGVGGVTVQLYEDVNGNGTIDAAEQTPIATTTTNSLGEYLFTGLDAGNYQVGFSTLPAGFTLTTKDVAGSNETNDSDGNPLNTAVSGNPATAGKTYTNLVSLAQGEDKLTVDLGIVAPANTNTLGGTVWFDTNSDGEQAGEVGPAIPGVPGVTVTLYNSTGAVVGTTVTDANGNYLFAGLPNGDYSVGFSNYPPGFAPTDKEPTNTAAVGSDADKVSGRTTTVTLDGTNRNDRSLDAGLVSTKAALGDRVWIDTNGNGIQDAGKAGVPGVTATLFRPGVGPDGIAGNADDAEPVSTTVTDQNGNYLFTGLDAGGYQVAFTTIPGAYNFTRLNVGADDAVDSDANPATGRTATITLAAGELNLTVDAGLTRPNASVGNKVWQDLDGDNVQDAGEPGVPGIVVELFDSNNNLIGTAITNGDGEYLITNVPPGTGYYVEFSNRPTGSTFVTQNAGADNTINSKPNPTTGQTAPFNVAAGQYVSNIDAGINLPFSLALTITNFTATKQNNTSVLNFSVANTTVGAVYEIERSIDGISFTTIGSINGGNSSYTFTDINPVSNAKNYYRIKEVGASRNVSYSEVRIVRFNNDIKIDIYPIPATSNINITLTDVLVRKPLVISLIAADGKEIVRKQIANSTGTESINVSRLASGNYVLRIQSDNEIVENRKVIISR
jgi:hypothetical protein